MQYIEMGKMREKQQRRLGKRSQEKDGSVPEVKCKEKKLYQAEDSDLRLLRGQEEERIG